ncbi:ABC transporter permease [Actinorhabdospora filicis]|uniref:ABC transporter permease n=1 Tax=Actinorhabdospora filicis TaxID=1785913 RepID=A0A9W6SQ46_9ACTN|nr:methionine ABC transporter permease [Actinorhabdospora filicis]GLZ80068.1 ABC transporter permease [Actinorhabdospora filicis]
MTFDEYVDLLGPAALETLQMVGLTTLWTVVFGLPLGVALYALSPRGLRPQGLAYKAIGLVVNIGRSVPFILLMLAIIPVTRLLVGTSIGSAAAVVPLAVAAVPFFARLVESSLLEVDPGLVEAARSMGAHGFGIVGRVLVPEALPSIIRNVTVTVVAVIGYSAMAGAIGGGGLGAVAVRFGYQRFQYDVMIVAVIVLVVFVQLIQLAGDLISRRLDRR